MVLLLDIAIANPCASSNLVNAARYAGNYLIDAVERKKSKLRGSFSATTSLLPLVLSTYGKAGSDLHAFIKKLAIIPVEHRSEIHSNESQHLAEETEVVHLWRRFSFVQHQALSFCIVIICRQEVALAGTRKLRSQGSVSVQAR